MKIARLTIQNFRGIRYASLLLPDHGVLIGDNNTGKSSILEAIDLALGPDRLSRRVSIEEHDFYQGKYLPGEEVPLVLPDGVPFAPGSEVLEEGEVEEDPQAEKVKPKIEVEVLVTDLNEEQQAHFSDYIEFWDKKTDALYQHAVPEGVDAANVHAALRVTFHGEYDVEDDDFTGKTFYTRSLTESDVQEFRKKDKQKCGFLYLRARRTGSRALSLEHGSLLDIILRLRELRPRIWEETIAQVASYNVASNKELGVTGILESISAALKKYVPKEWGVDPHLKISSLTREHLRTVTTAFLATGDGGHAAPFYRQGTGTINILVLALLSQIAEGKQNVVFAMEEPETAIPPYTQKTIVHEVRKLSAQALFTSHSPYVLEEFEVDETVVLHRDGNGVLIQKRITLPDSVKPKRYRQEFRTRFCEGLLARRVMVAEGATEAMALPVAARRLAELNPGTYAPLETLGICTMDAGSDSMVADLGGLYRDLGKTVFAICDKQTPTSQAAIEAKVDKLFMHTEDDFEDFVLNNTTSAAVDRFCKALDWPKFILSEMDWTKDPKKALKRYFSWGKGHGSLADFLVQCTEAEIPNWIRDACVELKAICDPLPPPPPPEVKAEDGDAAAKGASDGTD